MSMLESFALDLLLLGSSVTCGLQTHIVMSLL